MALAAAHVGVEALFVEDAAAVRIVGISGQVQTIPTVTAPELPGYRFFAFEVPPPGTASLELVGLMPLVAIVASLALQYAAVVFVAHATDDAARQAARAASLGRDPESAARGAVLG